jgi:hypothetical protein
VLRIAEEPAYKDQRMSRRFVHLVNGARAARKDSVLACTVTQADSLFESDICRSRSGRPANQTTPTGSPGLILRSLDLVPGPVRPRAGIEPPTQCKTVRLTLSASRAWAMDTLVVARQQHLLRPVRHRILPIGVRMPTRASRPE